MIDAQFSAPFTVAALAHRIPKTEWWREGTINSKAIHTVMDVVDLAEDSAMTASFLRSSRNVNRIPARVTMHLRDGRKFAASCLVPTGTSERTATSAEDIENMLSLKHRLLYEPYLSTQQTDRLLQALAALPSAETVQELSTALGVAVARPTDAAPEDGP